MSDTSSTILTDYVYAQQNFPLLLSSLHRIAYIVSTLENNDGCGPENQTKIDSVVGGMPRRDQPFLRSMCGVRHFDRLNQRQRMLLGLVEREFDAIGDRAIGQPDDLDLLLSLVDQHAEFALRLLFRHVGFPNCQMKERRLREKLFQPEWPKIFTTPRRYSMRIAVSPMSMSLRSTLNSNSPPP